MAKVKGVTIVLVDGDCTDEIMDAIKKDFPEAEIMKTSDIPKLSKVRRSFAFRNDLSCFISVPSLAKERIKKFEPTIVRYPHDQ